MKTVDALLCAEPRVDGSLSLSVLPPEPIHWLAPWPGAQAAMSDALQEELGLCLPAPGQILVRGGVQCIWAGKDAAFLVGSPGVTGVQAHGAVVDVSDGWIRFRLEGAGVADVMARLCPVDLRAQRFPGPTVLRSLLGQISAVIIAGSPEVEIWVMRSYAVSAWKDMAEAMASFAARQALLSNPRSVNC
jgi:sarcosine oxidase subunit gamma